MSWQAYVDTNLVGTGNVKQAALLGHDGTTWATSEGFTIDATEGKQIASHFCDGAAKAMEAGITINQVKYFFVRVDEQTGDKYRVLIGKKGAAGVTIYKTEQAIIVGVYGEGTHPGNCNNVVSQLGSYLVGLSY